MFDSCYNHDDIRAVFRCFDCKPDVVVRYCRECHEQVHSLQVFRLHKTQTIEQTEQRKLSQDVSDLETLVTVENDLLKDVLTTLHYTEQQEREMLRDVTIKTENRLHDIQQCHEKVDKAICYLEKVLSVIKLCSRCDEMLDDLKPAEDEVQEQAIGGVLSSLAVEFPVLIKSSLSKKGGFWMVRSDSAGLKKIAEIENSVKEHFSAQKSAVIKEGTICIASNDVRTEFWRVRIEKLCKDRLVTVHYLDHGQQENIPISNIYDIPPAVKQVPYQAMECCLFPYSMNISLPYEAKWCFKDLIHGKDVKAKICSKVILPEGNTLFHVQLTSIGPPPVNINQKVTDLMIQQRIIEKDGPVPPKETLVQHPSEEGNQVDDKSKPLEHTTLSIATTEPHDLRKSEEHAVGSSLPLAYSGSVFPEQLSTNAVAPVLANEKQQKDLPSVTLLNRPNVDEFVAVDVSRFSVKDQQGLKESVREVNPLLGIPEYVPIGYLNEQMYDRIFKECKTHFAQIKSLIGHARFFVVHVDKFQVVEAMKAKVWCCTDVALCKNINRVYRDQTARGNRHSVFVVFLSKSNVVGLVRVVCPCYTGPHCTILGRGLLWSHSCKGEFRIDLYNANKFSAKLLETERYREFTRENIVGKELSWEKGCEIIQKYEKAKRKSSVLDDACRMYSNDVKKDLGFSKENLSEGHQKPSAKAMYSLQDVETEFRYRNAGPAKKGRSMEGSDEFLAAVSRKTQDSAQSENWELEAEPVRVADIYSTITKNAANQDTTSEATTVQVQDSAQYQKDDSVASPSSEYDVVSKCVVNSFSAGVKSDAIKLETTKVEDDITPSVPVLEDSTVNQVAVAASPEVQDKGVPEGTEKKTAPDDSNLESATDSSLGLDASANSGANVNEELQLVVDTGMVDAVVEEEVSVQEELPESAEDQGVFSCEVITSKGEQGITKPAVPDAKVKQKVIVEEETSSESSTMQPTLEHLDKPVDSENNDKNLKSLPKLEEPSEEEQTNLIECSGIKDDISVEVKERFYAVSPPLGATIDAASESQENGEEQVNREKENKVDKANPSNSVATKIPDDTRLKQEEGGTWYCRASPESMDEEPSTPTFDWSSERASPDTVDVEPSSESSSASYSGKETTDASPSGLSMRNVDAIHEKDSSDNEETSCFLPVEPGVEYEVLLMSKPNQDNIFCARIYRDFQQEKEFRQFCKRMNDATEKRNEKVTNAFVMKFCCLKMKKNYNGTYRRVLIKKLLGQGKVVIHYIDFGFACESPIDDLRELDMEFQISFPPQSFECRILKYINKQDKVKISKLLPRDGKRGYGIVLDIFVKSIVEEIAQVDVLRVCQSSFNYHQ